MNAQQQLKTLRSRIQQLVVQGVAPPRSWISRYSVRNRPGGKIYHYYKLVEKVGNRTRQKYLGKRTNRKYRYWKAAIARRNKIQRLQRQVAGLERLLERQLVSPKTVSSRKDSSVSKTQHPRKLQMVSIQVPQALLSKVLALISQYETPS